MPFCCNCWQKVRLKVPADPQRASAFFGFPRIPFFKRRCFCFVLVILFREGHGSWLINSRQKLRLLWGLSLSDLVINFALRENYLVLSN